MSLAGRDRNRVKKERESGREQVTKKERQASGTGICVS